MFKSNYDMVRKCLCNRKNHSFGCFIIVKAKFYDITDRVQIKENTLKKIN